MACFKESLMKSVNSLLQTLTPFQLNCTIFRDRLTANSALNQQLNENKDNYIRDFVVKNLPLQTHCRPLFDTTLKQQLKKARTTTRFR